MAWMFSGARSFNQPLNNWNVSNVTSMAHMFAFASSFNQPLNKWNVSNVTHMRGMFSGARSFNQPLSKWNVSNDVRRWADRAEIAAVTRGSWVWPSAAETPPRAEVVEGGAY